MWKRGRHEGSKVDLGRGNIYKIPVVFVYLRKGKMC
jgi:hypothetical protein